MLLPMSQRQGGGAHPVLPELPRSIVVDPKTSKAVPVSPHHCDADNHLVAKAVAECLELSRYSPSPAPLVEASGALAKMQHEVSQRGVNSVANFEFRCY